MAKYKVTNLDAPIEADYWVDIPIRDPDTNKDMVDEEGRILVQRHVTRTVKQNEYQGIVNKIPTYDNLVTSYNTYVTENNRQVNLISEMATTATNNVTKLTETVNNHDSQIHALYTKINAIQGIDIDDFKLVTETNIKNIKNSYLPLVGGTLTGSLRVQSNETEGDLLVDNPSVGSIYLYASTQEKGLGAIGTNNVFARLANITPDNVTTFYGSLNGNATSSTKTTNDSVDRNIVNTYALKSHYPDRIGINWDTTFKDYVNLTVDQTTVGLITTANIAQQAVNYANTCNKATSANVAQKATSADYATNSTNAVNAAKAIQDKNGAQIDTTYFKSANGTFTGVEYFRNVSNSILSFNGGNTHDGGACLRLFGKNANGNQGVFSLVACTKEDASDVKQLLGTPAGALTWNNKHIVRSINGINANAFGDISITSVSHATNADHAKTADTANRAYPRMIGGGDLNFHWEGRDGQPTWLWGGEDGSNMYVYNPATFSVNRANGANEATNAYNLRATSHNDHFVKSEWDGSFFWTWVRAPDGGYRPVRVERANSAGYADNANHATNADTATKATSADHATVADRLASGSIIRVPNYARGTSFINIPYHTTGTFTGIADKDGFVVVYGGIGSNAGDFINKEIKAEVKVGNALLANISKSGPGGFWTNLQSSFFVKKGDVVSIILSDTGSGFLGDIRVLIFPFE